MKRAFVYVDEDMVMKVITSIIRLSLQYGAVISMRACAGLLLLLTVFADAKKRFSLPLAEGAVSQDQLNDANMPNLPLGNPDTMASDIPGEPLSPDDFREGLTMVHEDLDTMATADPIELAGLFQGDINLNSPEEFFDLAVPSDAFPAQGRNAIISMHKRWPNGVIPYVISSSYSEYESRSTPSLTQLPSRRCSSSVGRVGGAQALSLGPGCIYVGIVMHEMMHAAGFWHEQSRQDRDNFITINTLNIQNGMEYNFQKYGWDSIQSLGVDYDLGSIMHYGPYAFAKDRTKPTIIPRVTGAEIGQRRGFSQSDVNKLMKLYNCANTGEITTEAPITHITTDTCADNNQFCDTWAAMGECNKNPTWMNVNCKKACKQCGKECPDHNEHCSYWASKGECVQNAAYMGRFCKKSCGSCHSADEFKKDTCENSHKHCEAWATDGQCRSNPNYMLVWCRKSCKQC
ncbi:zinc metalloproteinase nas-4-like [Penaeus chinensis]|uniref:zinc metalloproteinase nas-4-like n=1 Tax=Penaeus chinensis TaxID=139456 RepID=UPI001FB78C43|nr:zinc metalloproteinase nas-4-like [Penaeus chinensis]